MSYLDYKISAWRRVQFDSSLITEEEVSLLLEGGMSPNEVEKIIDVRKAKISGEIMKPTITCEDWDEDPYSDATVEIYNSKLDNLYWGNNH